MAKWQIENKDVMTWCKEYTGPKFHALLADPPYELHFMQRSWDNSGIAFQSKVWAALSEHLLPGAFIFVFGSSRGWHRLAVAIEDAGFVFHPSIMVWGWVNGAGFPKATRIDTQIDKAAGKSEERKAAIRPIAYPDSDCWGIPNKNIGSTTHIWGRGQNRPERGQGGVVEYTEAATDLARAWEGYRYGRQALNPAVEMVICAQKPYEGRPVDSIVETGVGALFIDGARVGNNELDMQRQRGTTPGHSMFGMNAPNYGNAAGRWPPNFCLVHVPPYICTTCDGDGCDKCNDTGLVGGCRRVGTKRVKNPSGLASGPTFGKWGTQGIYGGADGSDKLIPKYHADPDGYEETVAWHCVESCAARKIGEQSGERKSAGKYRDETLQSEIGLNSCFGVGNRRPTAYSGETGTAARFFPQFGWAAEIAERLANSDQVRYCAKASRGEREAGLDALPVQKCGSLDGGDDSRIGKVRSDGAIQHTTGKPKARNIHCAVKPISLVKWLATLLLPPPEYAPRRILVPFCGVASEMIAAILAGWDFVQGIEMSEEYCAIGEARLKFWSQFDSYEAAMDTARNIQQTHRKQDAQAKSGQLKLSLL